MTKQAEIAVNKFFGLKRKQVDKYINELEKEHASKISELEQKIQKSKKEKEQLDKKLKELEEKLLKHFDDPEFVSLMMKRAQKAADTINRIARDEVNDIVSSARGKLDSYENEISNTRQKLSFTRQHMNNLLKNMIGMLEEDSNIPNSDTNAASARNKFKVLSYFDKTLNNESKEDFDLEGNNTQKDSISEFFERAVNEAASHKQENTDEMDRENTDEIKQEKTRPNTSEGFWDKDDDYDNNTEVTAESGYEENYNNTSTKSGEDIKTDNKNTKTNNDTKKTTHSKSQTEAAGTNAKANETGPKTAEINAEATEKGPKTAETASETKRESRALSDEIEFIRHKYIAGKICGKDLYTDKGELIIAKNKTITPEVVEKAEQEGKLSDLIVNMILPDIGT